MNERIKELEKRAFDAVWDLDNDPIGPGTHFRPDGFEEKFAELIVKECVDRIKNADMTDLEGSDPDDVLWLVERQIVKHFGVEE